MTLAVNLAAKLKVVVAKRRPAMGAGEASWVKLLARVGLEVLSLDSTVAPLTQGAVQLMVVMLAVRVVINNIKVGRLERLLACFANETRFVPTSSESAVSSLDGFAGDELSTAAAVASVGFGGRTSDWRPS